MSSSLIAFTEFQVWHAVLNGKLVLMSIPASWRSRRIPAQAFICVVLAGVALASMSGCEDETDQSKLQTHPFASETVTVAVPNGLGLAEAWKGLLDEWSQQTGAKYRLVEYPVETTTQKDLPTGDLLVIPFTRLGDFVAHDRLAPMPPNLFGTDSPAAGSTFLRDCANGFYRSAAHRRFSLCPARF